MTTLQTLVLINVILHSFLVGISYDLTLVKLAARKRVGNIVFADFIRVTDLGSGIIAHSLLGGPAILLSIATSIYAIATHQTTEVRGLLAASGVATLAYAACSGKIVPLTLGLKLAPKDEKALGKRFDEFTLWSWIRGVLQATTLSLLVWALIVIIS